MFIVIYQSSIRGGHVQGRALLFGTLKQLLVKQYSYMTAESKVEHVLTVGTKYQHKQLV